MPEDRYPVRYHPLFDSDVIAAGAWYDRQWIGLGADFVDCVEDATRNLAKDPERRSLTEFGVRYWPVERYPYVVFYELLTNEILILGVMHTSREHEEWLRRSK